MLNTDRPRFFVDAMLGNMARKLRMLGFDSRYDSSINDGELISVAKDEARIIVTMDRELAGHSKRRGCGHILVCESGDREQIVEILEFVGLKIPEIDGYTARCTRCNSVTEPVDRHDVSDIVPTGVLEFTEKFWMCIGCGQIYWEGTHMENLRRSLGGT